jgi:hypothetical protein
MATILNPTPVTPQVFSGMWVQHLNIILPTEARPNGMLHGRLLPYDGANLLALGEKRVHRPINANSDGETQAMIASVTEEVKRQAGKTANPVHIAVMARDPSQPVVAFIRFDDRTHHRIPDCFALAGTDQQFAQVFVGVLAELARLSGCEIDV